MVQPGTNGLPRPATLIEDRALDTTKEESVQRKLFDAARVLQTEQLRRLRYGLSLCRRKCDISGSAPLLSQTPETRQSHVAVGVHVSVDHDQEPSVHLLSLAELRLTLNLESGRLLTAALPSAVLLGVLLGAFAVSGLALGFLLVVALCGLRAALAAARFCCTFATGVSDDHVVGFC